MARARRGTPPQPKDEDGTRPESAEDDKKSSRAAVLKTAFSRPTAIPTSPLQVVDNLNKLREKHKIVRADMAITTWFSTGNLPLDLAINQGLPGGRIVEISGPELSCKSTKAMEIIEQAQKAGGRGDYIDLEVGMTMGIAQDMARIRTEPEFFELWKPDTAEQAFALIDDLIPVVGNSRRPSVIVLDSVPAIVPAEEHATPYDETPQLAAIARLLTRLCRKNLSRLDRYPSVLLIWINHINTPFKVSPFDNAEIYTSGGKAARYYPSVRLRFEKMGKSDRDKVKGSETVARERLRVHIWKNRVGASHRSVILPVNFVRDSTTGTQKGFDNARSCLEFLRDEKVLYRVPAKTDTGGATNYWAISGMEDVFPKRLWRDWVLGFNTEERIRVFLEDCVEAAAKKKWTPDEDADLETEDNPENELDFSQGIETALEAGLALQSAK